VNRPGGDPQIVSCASCTTNCITPVVEVMHHHIGVQRAVMMTTHAYTGGQQLVDGPSRSFRCGRAGAANLVPTSTGAAQGTTRAVPELAGRFDGIAVCAPIPVGTSRSSTSTMAWYDNEWGFTHQMIREARSTLAVRRPPTPSGTRSLPNRR
jgi:glyceraldehyde-3-phosphate dehydrogenase/erythrose-4-phosphate dehydrogenase